MNERFCPLTEQNCTLTYCKSGCYGVGAAEALARLQHGDLGKMAIAYKSAIGHLPIELQKIIIKRSSRKATLDRAYKPTIESLFPDINK